MAIWSDMNDYWLCVCCKPRLCHNVLLIHAREYQIHSLRSPKTETFKKINLRIYLRDLIREFIQGRFPIWRATLYGLSFNRSFSSAIRKTDPLLLVQLAHLRLGFHAIYQQVVWVNFHVGDWRTSTYYYSRVNIRLKEKKNSTPNWYFFSHRWEPRVSHEEVSMLGNLPNRKIYLSSSSPMHKF